MMKNQINKYGRASTIKIKINNNCINKCSFCVFHQSNDMLSLNDINKFLNLLDNLNHYRIVINGGEPTIHPDYLQIIEMLRSYKEKRKVRLELGTNMIPFSFRKYKEKEYFKKSLNVFSRFQIGCDDEHNNIDIVEHYVPILISKNKRVAINAVNGFYSKETKNRLLKLKDKYGITLYFSELHHFYSDQKPLNKITRLCVYRDTEFLLDSNGNGFFCFRQEFEDPLFNLFTNSGQEIKNILETKQITKPYKFCSICRNYKPSNDYITK